MHISKICLILAITFFAVGLTDLFSPGLNGLFRAVGAIAFCGFLITRFFKDEMAEYDREGHGPHQL